ncbi:MAG: NADH-quinone oxidoreductase subunit NuoG [Lysobacterales bacterium]
MNAQVKPAAAAPDLVNIEVDGQPMQVAKGSMIIHATDAAKVAVPRFCYHEKLSIAANCRMCLVDVEKSPKPVPACATPVMEGMKIFTRSERAQSSQRNVMEFLLINHPLDCPICDQGGECELQDVAMGYGRSVSRFSEQKRVVADEDIGPLIATEMTRCIQCTRCVRFMNEIAGSPELGGIGRGEHLEIGTYIGRAIDSELGGNIIDVCPVGALTNKPFRFRARAWELIARESIAYHDALGSNLWLHTRRGEVLRTVPRDNENINESWLSDRDRYSHQGLVAEDRATQPMLRRNGELVEVSWEEAITAVAQELRRYPSTEIAALVAPLASSEEGFLLAGILRALGSGRIDHRLRHTDFSDPHAGAAFAMPLAEIEHAPAILLIGSNPRLDQPLLGHRVRKAARSGAAVHAINPVDYQLNFNLAGRRIVAPQAMVQDLLALAKAVGVEARLLPLPLRERLPAAVVDAQHQALAAVLHAAERPLLLLGDFAVQHPCAADLRALARAIAEATGAALNELPAGANALGLAAAGVLPGVANGNAAAILAEPPKVLLVYQAGSQDCAEPARFDAARRSAESYVYFGAYACSGVRSNAQAVLPIGLPPEIDGSYVNCDGRMQSFAAAAKLPGAARPGWRVLRALAAELGIAELAYMDIDALRAAMAAAVKPASPTTAVSVNQPVAADALGRVATVPIYRSDAVVRRAPALQQTPLARPAAVHLHPDDAGRLSLAAGDCARVESAAGNAELPVAIDARVARSAAWIELGHNATRALSGNGAPLRIRKL